MLQRITFVICVWMVLAGIVLTWNAGAHGRSVPRTHSYPAVIRCASMAEDTAAHVHLIRYSVTGDDVLRIVYHCEHSGY